MARPLSSALGPTAVHGSLEQAIAGFQAALTDAQRQELQAMKRNDGLPDSDAVLIFTAGLDSINRKKGGKSTATRLHSFLSSVGDFCSILTGGKPCNIVDTYVSSHPEIAALVWGSVKLTMVAIVNFASFNDGPVNLLSKIARLCPIISEYRPLYPESTKLRKSIASFYSSIIHCCKHIMEVMKPIGYMQAARRLATSFDQEFKPDLDDIQNCRNVVKEYLHLAGLQADQKHQHLQSIERQKAEHSRSIMSRFFSQTEHSLHKLGDQQSATRKQQILDSLSTHDFMRSFKQSTEKRYGNTTQWVFETPQFRRWLDGESPVLWCSGKIGSGKTIIASSTIHHILTTKGSLGCPVSFFFAQSDDTHSLKAHAILRSILLQRLRGIKISRAVEDKIHTIVSSSTASDTLSLLIELMPELMKSYIVVDGLDECDTKDRKELLKTLSALISTNKNVRLFLSSRVSLLDEVTRQFPDVERLTLDCEATNEDIAIYISDFLDERLEEGDLKVGDPVLITCIKTALREGAQGMFLWAYFQLQDICQQHCDEDIRRTLSALPRDLAETFQRALHRIEYRRHTAAARKIFPWVAASKRPLSLGELREAIATEIGQKYSEPARLYNDMQNIGSWCENLVQIDEENQIVQFAHSSVRDFLLEVPSNYDLSGFHLLIEDEDHRLGEICVTYLNFKDFETTLAKRPKPLLMDSSKITRTIFEPGSKRAALVSRFVVKRKPVAYDLRGTTAISSQNPLSKATTLEGGHPFLKYASAHWIAHTTYFQETRSKTWRLWKTMVTHGHGVAQMPWGDGIHYNAMWSWAYQNRHYATIRLLVANNEVTNHGTYRLQDAASEDDIQLVDALLGGTWPTKAYAEALLAAAGCGHFEIVERLLEAKVNVNARHVYRTGWTALQAAARGGYLEVVERLLAARADINAKPASNGGRTAIQAAAEGGYLEVVERLLAARADVNAEPANDGGRTAIQAAAEGGYLEVVERLLAARADVNAEPANDGGRTAIQAAAGGGHLEIVERLLAAKADVNARHVYRTGWTALQAAARGGYLEVVERLLAARADINAKPASNGGRTAIQAAAEGGYLEVVNKLLAAKADVNAEPAYHSGRRALQAAAEGGHLEIVERLLAAKADVNAKATGNGGLTALQAAARGGHLEIVERLLAAKADVNLKAAGNGGLTALEAAAGGGHLEIVERLLAAKADVNVEAAGHQGLTALQAAARGGHLEIVERLLVAKADVNLKAVDSGGRTALEAAARGGHLEIVERLLAAKADVNAKATGNGGLTALQAAAEGGHLEVVDRLKSAGAR
ncbi:ankyrin repeat domain-containing protein 50 [Microdochium nivale]|nr:ankyrin repeat domain-containing protein 50 [Microdochium nivale]